MPAKYFNLLIDDAGLLRGDELDDWLQAEFAARFKYLQDPPRWLRRPMWPIETTGPLVLVGQLRIPCDAGEERYIYVFLDPATKSAKTVVQVFAGD